MMSDIRKSLREEILKESENLQQVLRELEDSCRNFHGSLTQNAEELIRNPKELEDFIVYMKDFARLVSSYSSEVRIKIELILERVFKHAEKLEEDVKHYSELLEQSRSNLSIVRREQEAEGPV